VFLERFIVKPQSAIAAVKPNSPRSQINVEIADSIFHERWESEMESQFL
jgi:hypothetical protein